MSIVLVVLTCVFVIIINAHIEAKKIFNLSNVNHLLNIYLILSTLIHIHMHTLGGERNRCQLAKVVRSGANVLLLDEPTNDLDVDTIRSLEEALLDFAGCALVVSHDRFFLDRICTHILAYEGNSEIRFFTGNINTLVDT